jgi:hypothetical protein
VGAANDQGHRAGPFLPAGQVRGQGLAGPGLPLAGQGNHERARRKALPDAGGLLGALAFHASRPAGLAQFHLVQPEVSAQAAGIVVTGLAVVRPEPPHREEGDLHQAYIPRRRWTAATRSMASM